jgi:hypothetical protein
MPRSVVGAGEQRVRLAQVLHGLIVLAQAAVHPAQPAVGRARPRRMVEQPGLPQHGAEHLDRFLGVADQVEHIAQVVQRGHARQRVVLVEHGQAAGVEIHGFLVGIARPRLVAAGQVTVRGSPAIAAALVELGQEFELLLGAAGQLGLQPVGGQPVIARQAVGLGALDDELALQVVLEHQLQVARNGRVLDAEPEQIIALHQVIEQGHDALPHRIVGAPAIAEIALGAWARTRCCPAGPPDPRSRCG